MLLDLINSISSSQVFVNILDVFYVNNHGNYRANFNDSLLFPTREKHVALFRFPIKEYFTPFSTPFSG